MPPRDLPFPEAASILLSALGRARAEGRQAEAIRLGQTVAGVVMARADGVGPAAGEAARVGWCAPAVDRAIARWSADAAP